MAIVEQPMRGKVCIVTGATGGIGLETARALARMGGTVIGVGRNPVKCAATSAQLMSETGNERIEYLVADLSAQPEVRNLAEQFKQRYSQADVLVNNAGAIFSKRTETADGLEMTFALNHLSYFLLTNLLLEQLVASPAARIVNVSSAAHQTGRLIWDDLQRKRRYWGFDAYAQSKLANVLFTYELARRLEGTHVTANTLHPGLVASNFAVGPGLINRMLRVVYSIVGVTPEQGAQTSIYLATSPEVEGITGRYWVNQRQVASSSASYDAASARKLWQVSEELTGGVVDHPRRVPAPD